MHFRNILWNLAGLGLPLLIAALTVPKLLTLIGPERFGFLALAWGLIGYAGALDLGIGRAITQRISVLRGGADNEQIPDVVATAVRITLVTGGVGMVLIVIAALSGAYRLIHADMVPAAEIELSMLLLGLALPMQAISASYRGVNEAYLNFKSINILRLFLGAANFGAPFLVALYTNQVHWLVATLVLSRCLALVFYRRCAHHCMVKEGHIRRGNYGKQFARSLLQFGGWFTLSSMVSPFLVQADRFFVGALISASAVTLYVIPYEVTVQTLLFVGAVTTVAFPVITHLIHSAPQQAAATFQLWLYRVTGLMLMLMAVLAWVMPYLLHLWIGPQLTEASVRVGQILCIGVFFNAIGAMYFALLHAYGKTKMTAMLHLAELPFFIAALYVLISHYGVAGAAIAWVLRMAVDTLALVVMARIIKQQKFIGLGESTLRGTHE
ncbi:flippase [Methylobacter sp. G7]|uniref:flippase n=1 Tax=Methylobacter sp. G7 TaxID=3230117 RepID=UPI003D806443